MAIVFKTPKSALNTTSKAIQNLGNGECPPCPECPEVNLETADVNYTENGEYTLTPEGDGFSKVDITVNVDTETPYNEGYAAGETAGIATGKAEGIAEQKAKLTSTTITENGTSAREDGWNSVTVNVDVTTPYNNGVAAGEAAQKAKLTSLNVTSNGTYNKEDGYNSVTVAVPSDINNQNKTVDPSTSSQSISADSGYSGLGTVTVNAVTAAIDANIAAGNIKKNVSILGVTGSYDPQPDLETKTVTYTTNDTYTIAPTAGKDGMSEVTVTVNVAGGGASCPDWSSIGWDCNDVNASGLAADVAYTAQKKAEYEGGTIHNFANDTKLIYAPKIAINDLSTFTNCVNLRLVPQFESVVYCGHLFDGCSSLTTVPLFDTSEATNMDFMFGKQDSAESVGAYTGAAVTTIPQYDMSNVTSAIGMFRGCTKLTTIPDLNTPKLRDIAYYLGNTAAGSMFSGCLSLIAIPNIDLTNVTDMSHFAMGPSGIISGPNKNMALTTVPLLNTPNVARIKDAFWKCNKITTLGGFKDLGKSFVSTDTANYHTLSFTSSTVLTKESIMNVINNLAAPDDTAVTDATLKLSAASYALLDASDIAIATAKRWSVTSD